MFFKWFFGLVVVVLGVWGVVFSVCWLSVVLVLVLCG